MEREGTLHLLLRGSEISEKEFVFSVAGKWKPSEVEIKKKKSLLGCQLWKTFFL